MEIEQVISQGQVLGFEDHQSLSHIFQDDVLQLPLLLCSIDTALLFVSPFHVCSYGNERPVTDAQSI
jgi:hypothetical protein